MKISLAKSKSEIEKCFPVMVQLRIHLTEKEFVERVRRQQKQGYKLAFLKQGSKIMSLAGFRILDNLFLGKFLYIDDLITDAENRSKRNGDKLFDWVTSYAKKRGCKAVDLDSGVHRFDAHRFYMRKRMVISDHHFSLALGEMNYTPEAVGRKKKPQSPKF